MSDALFAEMLCDFRAGKTKPSAWLRQLDRVPGLVEWVKERLRLENPFPGDPDEPPALPKLRHAHEETRAPVNPPAPRQKKGRPGQFELEL